MLVGVTEKEVVNMPAYGELMSINHLVSNARVIWVDGEADGKEIRNKFSIKK